MSDERRGLQELGLEIANRRRKKSMDLQKISGKTKIRIQFLEAIESGEIQALPGPLYARGFIRTYLELIDSMDLWPEFESCLNEMAPSKSRDSIVQYFPTQKGFQKVSSLWIFAFLFLAIAVSLYLIWQQKDTLTAQMGSVPDLSRKASIDDRSETSADMTVSVDSPSSEPIVLGPMTASADLPPVDALAVKPIAENPAQQTDSSWIPGREDVKQAPPSQTKVGVLTIQTSGPCWVGITTDGGSSSQKTMSRGESLEVKVDKRTIVRLGNAGAVVLLWGGREMRNIGKSGEVVTLSILPDGTIKRF